MTEPIVLEAGEWPSERIVAALEEGQRVVVHTEFMGSTYEVTMRWDGDTYYCDSPTRLHKHEDPEGFRGCLRRLGYSADTVEEDVDTPA